MTGTSRREGADGASAHPRAAAIEKQTGTALAAWVERLDAAGARELPHGQIAALLGREHGIAPWWSQMIAVAYEQVIGRRVEGQSSSGTYSASVSRTIPGPPDVVLARWESFIGPCLADLGLERARTSRTERWIYWRADGIDGSRVSSTLQGTRDGRTVLSLGHERLASADDRQARRADWTRIMKEFTAR